MDRDLAARKGYVTIEGDKAIFPKSWQAGGTEVSWDMVHYDVQLIGGVALHKGRIAEMATGEGKTLVATLPVYLNALAGRGVHLVTVNDYLAKRDSEWMGPLYEFHGLKVDCIDKHQPNSPERRAAYNADTPSEQTTNSVSITCAITWRAKLATSFSASTITQL